MSLSTLTICSPQVCRLPRDRKASPLLREPPPTSTTSSPSFTFSSSSHRSFLDWPRISQVSLIAAAATTLSQLVSAPIDVCTRALKALPTSPRLPPSSSPKCSTKVAIDTLVTLLRKQGPTAFFRGLPLHLMKRVPTKALTVALFEVGTQLEMSYHPLRRAHIKNSLSQHVVIATLSGSLAVLLCYPMHSVYYAARKHVCPENILQSILRRPSTLYAGAVPALLATAPAVIVDYVTFRTLRARTNHDIMDLRAVIIAAMCANLLGGAVSEPFKAVSRKMAVQALRDGRHGPSVRSTMGNMLQNGVGEFWRGFPARAVRYAVSAVVSKATVQHLKQKRATENNSNKSTTMILIDQLNVTASVNSNLHQRRAFAPHLQYQHQQYLNGGFGTATATDAAAAAATAASPASVMSGQRSSPFGNYHHDHRHQYHNSPGSTSYARSASPGPRRIKS